VKVGSKVGNFALPTTGGGVFRLQDAAGKKLVIYFYPKDMTSGCTQEAQDFRDMHPALKKAGTRIVGVSRESLASHEKFKARDKLPFELLADEAGKVCELFDVIHEKSMYGRKFMGIVRSTFLIDASGKLAREWRKVKVPGHAAEVLEAAQSL
jgi:thioredoxin-dependent peroxiredoxin